MRPFTESAGRLDSTFARKRDRGLEERSVFCLPDATVSIQPADVRLLTLVVTLLPVMRWWSKFNHADLAPSRRHAVQTVLFAANRLRGTDLALPTEMWLHILERMLRWELGTDCSTDRSHSRLLKLHQRKYPYL